MHELSIVEELVRAIREELSRRPQARLKSVLVRVGTLRLIEPATLQCCFEAATADTPLAGAQLRLEPVEARARCRACRLEFAVKDQWFECPHCGDTGSELLRGDELQLVSLEIEMDRPAPLPTDQAKPVVEGTYANQT